MTITRSATQLPKSLQKKNKAQTATASWERCPGIELAKNVSYLVISDIHLFHNRNPTEDILENLDVFFDRFSPDSRFTGLDVIFIAGDIFDTLLYLKHPSVVKTLDFFRRLMKFCSIYGIILRILEGTPSHDYKQAVNFQPIADAFGDGLDYRYVQSLSIEKITSLNMTVLYVPDEWGGSAKECHRQVELLLEEQGLQQVDIGIMHGMFEYQLPEVAGDPLVHCSDYYLGIVKYFINIGHIHTPSFFSRILAQGSFDRTAHGQEEKKGAIQVNLRLNGSHSFDFIENKLAKTFKTIEVGVELEEAALAKVHKQMLGIRDGSYIQIRAPKGAPVFIVFDSIKSAYPLVTFKKDEREEKSSKRDQLSETINLNSEFVPIHITKESIVLMMLDEIKKSCTLSEEDERVLVSELTALHI